MTSSIIRMASRAWRSAWTPPHPGTDKHVGKDVNKHVGNDVIRYKNDHKSKEVSLDTSAYRYRQTRKS